MYHYTYLIQHRYSDMRYIGKRSCKCLPQQDITYWGSSKHLPKDIQKDHVKIILKEHSSAKEAIEHEILLHKLNNVSNNPHYYNKANQTAIGFDTTGLKLVFTEEHKRKISTTLTGMSKTFTAKQNNSIAQKKLYENGYVNPRTGIIMSNELKAKISLRKKELKCSAGTKNPKFTPWFISYPTYTQLFYDITKVQQSLTDGYASTYYQTLADKSKGVKLIKRGKMKGCVIGHICINS